MSVTACCPDPERLRQLLLGRVSEQAAADLEQHLEHCDHCGRLLPSLEADDALVEAMRARRTIILEPSDLDTIQILLPRLHELRPAIHTLAVDAGSGNQHAFENAETNGDGGDFLGPPQSSDEIGRLGHYRVLELLGQGGMGMVFRAEDSHLQRTVALKIMRPEFARKASAKERFLREARATATLEHDHIVTVFQVGEDRGIPFLAMQLLKGMTLQDLLDQPVTPTNAPLSLARILRVGREIAAGLSAAHRQGLIHRDIKPANIWLDATADGRVKILDFGLARVVDEGSQLTHFGTIIGSPSFMAPEQARHSNVDGRADLFSLGCVLYRLIAGRLPWAGNDAVSTLVAVATEEPVPLQELNPRLPVQLTKLVAKLLAKNPEDRPQSAAAVVSSLEALERELPAEQLEMVAPGDVPAVIAASAEQRHSRWAGRRRLSWWAAAGGLAALLLGAVICVKTDSGVLEINTAGDAVRVVVEQHGKDIEIIDAQGMTKVSLHSGQYQLRLDGASDNIRLDRQSVDITRGGLVTATVSFKPAADKAAAGLATAPAALTNSLDMSLVLIPAGEFMMGSPATEVGRQADEQQHRVVITKPFYLGATDVTLGQFRQFIAASSYEPEAGDAWKHSPFTDRDDYPVGHVTWNDAVAFCDWLSRKEASRYRLPTEAEWEYACRAGTRMTRFCGDDVRQLAQYAWYSENSENKLHPVGQLKPNPWGLYDMYGNMWQWTADWYSADYYANSSLDDPPGPAQSAFHVMRGGSFAMPVDACRSACRHGFHPSNWHRRHVGFRVALTEMPPSPPAK